MEVKIRYKTDTKPEDTLHWRVIIDDVEYHASEVKTFCPTYTTKDIIKEGIEKWHISCKANVIEWENKICIIK
jgi:hypothetical protein